MRPVRRSLVLRALMPVVAGVSGALVISGVPALPLASPAAAADTTSSSSSAASVQSRPDTVSASVTARVSGHRVEDLSQRTESSQVFANPDGSWTTEAATQPEFVKDETGTWHDIETSLVERDGHLEPKYALADLALPADPSPADSAFATLHQDGKELDWRWPTALPAPVVDGDKATYPDVVPGGGDLVVTATPTGFTHDIVLDAPPAAAVADPDGQVSWTVPVATHGADLTATAAGGLEIAKDDGTTLATAPAPVAYDASVDPGTGQDTTPTGYTSGTVPVAVAVGSNAAGTPTMTLSTESSYLTDPATTYPVTIDPAFTVQTGSDSWIDNSTPNTAHPSDGWLDVGDGGSHVARAFLHFGDSKVLNLTGKDVLSATLQLRNYFSNSCTAATILAQRLTSSWSSATTWNNQPTATTTGQAGFSPAYGASGCAADWASWNVTDIVAYWAAHADSNHGIRIKANDETNPNSWRQYRSLETDTSDSVIPKLSVTYNTAPTIGKPGFGSPKTTYPATSTGTTYTSSARPTATGTVSDPDGGAAQVTFRFVNASTGDQTATCTTGWVPVGSQASCAPSSVLPDATYQVSARAYDTHDYSAWSATNQLTVVAHAPAAPVISCSDYANKSWTVSVPDGTTSCSITISGSGIATPASLAVVTDGVSRPSTTSTTTTVKLTKGQHKITATVTGRSGLQASATYVFGFGTFSITAPAADGPVTTTGGVGIDASGPPDQTGTAIPAVKVKWRLAASGDDENTSWTEDTAAAAGLKVTSDADGVNVRGTWDSADATIDAATGTTLDDRKPNLLDIEICVEYAAGEQCSWAVSHQQILRVAHAFGDGFPTTDLEAGPDSGQAALWTGEAAFDATDADLPAGLTDLTISRTLNTLDDPATYPDHEPSNLPTTASHVFGKGWSASLDGPDDGGYAGWQVYDSTRYDGTIDLVDTDGDVMVFGPKSGLTRRTSATFATDWVGLDPDTAEAGTTARLDIKNGVFTVVDVDGTTTTFAITNATTITNTNVANSWKADAQFQATSIHQPGDTAATSYSYDTTGRVTRILAPTSADCANNAKLPAGCRALQLDYAALDTTTAGEYPGEVTKITALIGSGTGNDASTHATVVAAYAYDSAGRLVSVTDPRNNLTTGYTYDGSSYRLASIKPAGQTAIDYKYNTATSGHPAQLVQVTRERPSSDSPEGTARLTTIVYNAPVSGEDATNAGLPDLSTDTVTTGWHQQEAPSYAAAVFGPDLPADADPGDLSTDDWTYAALSYTDDRGYTINTADYGAGQWLLTATDYDTLGNPVRTLDENDIAQLQAKTMTLDQVGTYAWYNTEQTNAAGEVTLPADSVVTDTYGPAHDALVPDADGKMVHQMVRPHTHTDYDQGAPNNDVDPATGQAYALPTTVTTGATDPANAATNGLTTATGDTDGAGDHAKDLQVLSVVKTGYDNAVPGGAADAGWSLGLASTSTTVMDDDPDDTTANITTKTAYNAQGQVISSSQPNSNGDDPGTTQTIYYTADTSADADSCDSHPAWAGLVCQTKAAGNPNSGPSMITTTYTGYNDLLQPTSNVETSGDTTRTTTTSYLADGRTEHTTTTVDGLDGSAPIPATNYSYDDQTGLPTTTTPATGDPITTGYDTWGRQASYQIGTGTPTFTTYDEAGRTATVTDSAGTVTSYAYDGAENSKETDAEKKTDLAGHLERRGLPTQVTTTSASNVTATFTGAYDAAGNLVTQQLPGGLFQHSTYDTAGQLTQSTYNGDITTTGDDGNTATTPDVEWLSWGQAYDAAGRIAQDWTPDGAAYQGGTTGAAAAGYAHQYDYDRAGRLTQVIDQTALATTVDDALPDSGDPDPATVTGCVIRRYAFDHDGNRTSLTRIPAATDGTCQTGADPTGTATQSWDHNLADRITDDGYVYDNLGRTTTIPAADTPQAATAGTTAGDLAIGYYDDDTVHTLTQAGQTTTYALDADGRPATQTTGPESGAADDTASTTELGYVDDSDSPAWETTTTGSSSTREVYATGLDGDLAATLTTGDNTSSLQIAVSDPHGDTVTQITIPTSTDGTTTNAAGIDDWTDTDEYGNPLNTAQTGATATNPDGQTAGDPATSDGGLGYGWTGAKQRATSPTGVLLMGARLYNPVTGTFTSLDPIPGGNTTPYAYPQDPINGYDLDGQMKAPCEHMCAGGPKHLTPMPPLPKKKHHGGGIFHAIGHAVKKHIGTAAYLSGGGLAAGEFGHKALHYTKHVLKQDGKAIRYLAEDGYEEGGRASRNPFRLGWGGWGGLLSAGGLAYNDHRRHHR